MIYFHTYKSSPLQLNIDIVSDIRRLNDMSIHSKKAGMIILGGGVCKHQIANAMLFRNGADYAVYINTGQEYDGSDSGARPDEAVSWGKIRAGAKSVKVSYPIVILAQVADTPGLRRRDPRFPADRGFNVWQGPLGISSILQHRISICITFCTPHMSCHSSTHFVCMYLRVKLRTRATPRASATHRCAEGIAHSRSCPRIARVFDQIPAPIHLPPFHLSSKVCL